jgi:hypothetical protein
MKHEEKIIDEEDGLTEFITDLLLQTGFPPEEHDELIEEIEPVLMDRIVTKLTAKMNAKQKNEADELLEHDEGEKFLALCQKAIPNYDEYFASILEEFEEEYLKEFEDEK